MKLTACDRAVLSLLRKARKRLSGNAVVEALPRRDEEEVKNSCVRLLGLGRIDLALDWTFFAPNSQKG